MQLLTKGSHTCTSGGGGGGGEGEVLLGIFGSHVWLGSSNPDPISDQNNNMSFSGTLFQTCPLKSIPIFRPGFWNLYLFSDQNGKNLNP